MSDFLKNIGTHSKTPLGIISIFVTLVYAMAALVIGSNSLLDNERIILVIFLCTFPIIILFTFCWLLTKHHTKLLFPKDFNNDETYMKVARITSSVQHAAAKTSSEMSDLDISNIVKHANTIIKNKSTTGTSRKTILWVDDRPENNTYERDAFQEIGLHIDLSLNTDDAIDKLEKNEYIIIISDMGRKEGPREGYKLLDIIRSNNINTPFYFYTVSNLPEHKKETLDHGGQGCTNNPSELFEMVVKTVIAST